MTPEAIEKIYEDISQLQIELEPDPTVLGPQYINRTVSVCRNYLNKASLTLLRLSRERRAIKSRLSGEEVLLSAERDRLLAEDDTVKRQANIRDREAVANTMLRDRLNVISGLKNELLDLETVEKAVTLIHSELVRTSNEIKTQRSLLMADRISGAGYGDEWDGPKDAKGRPLPRESIEEDELDKLMAGTSIADLKVAADQKVSETPEVAPEAVQAQKPQAEVPEPATAPTEAPKTPVAVKVSADPSQGLEEDPGVAKFLESESESGTQKAQIQEEESEDDFLAGILKNL